MSVSSSFLPKNGSSCFLSIVILFKILSRKIYFTKPVINRQKGGCARFIGSNHTSNDTDLGQPCNTCNCESSEIYTRSGKVHEGYRIKQHTSLLISMGRLMIWVSALRPYSPGGMLNTFVRTCTRLLYEDKKSSQPNNTYTQQHT